MSVDPIEGGARLAKRLGGPVKFACIVRKSADQGFNAACMRIHGDNGAIDLGNLAQPVNTSLIGQLFDINNITDRYHIIHTAHGARAA